MININLLIKPPPRIRWQVVGRIGLAAGLIGAVGIAATGWVSDYRNFAATNLETKSLLGDYERVAESMTALQQQVEALKREQAQAERLGGNQRFSQSRILAELLVTPDQVWVTQVRFEEGGVLIQGEAETFQGAIAYLESLRASSLLQAVEERKLITIQNSATRFTYFGQIRGEGKAQ